MRKSHVVSDWSVSKLLLNDDRREIVDRCRGKAMSLQELAQAMNLNPGSVHNHIHKLHDAGLLKIESTRVINGITEKKYRRTGAFFSTFHVAAKDVPARNRALAKIAAKRTEACLEFGKRPAELFDLNLRVSRKKLAELSKLAAKLRAMAIAADGSGDVPVSSFLVLGETCPKKRKRGPK